MRIGSVVRSRKFLRVSYPIGDAYQERFDELAASGTDVHGEATLVRAYSPARVLDAGCGTGRVAIELARHGVDVVGIDVDDEMLATARKLAPDLDWRRGDLAATELGHDEFDVAVLAGNVLIFTTPGTNGAVLANVTRALRPHGRLIAGFSLQSGGYDLATLDADATDAGLQLTERFRTWNREPYTGGDYAVSIFVKSGAD
jgi:SAM-dependent methyltransferase